MIAATKYAPSQKIVVYEPDEYKRMLLGLVLLTHGYVVETAADEARAHALCEGFFPDLVLVGLSTPLSTSFEVYDRFRRRHTARSIAFIPGEFKLCDLFLNGRCISQGETPNIVAEIAKLFTNEREAAHVPRALKAR